MAATAAARRLTEAHRLAQARLGADTIRVSLDAWDLLDPSDLDGTIPRWLRVMRPAIGAQHATSAELAANYVATFRTLELGAGAGQLTPALATLDAAAVDSSLLVTGPYRLRSDLAKGVRFDTALETAKTSAARSAMRHAMAGGRGTITRTTAADRRALGWARATSGDPCAFCAMLASRGPVYGADSGGFQAHDGCSCTAEPVYRSDASWPAGSDRWADLWQEATTGLSPSERAGNGALNAFRRTLGE